MNNRYISVPVACIAAITLIFSGCSGIPDDLNDSFAAEYNNENSVYYLSSADLKTDHEDIQDIETDDIFCITEGGTYRVSGDQIGQIYIDAHDEIVYLIIENAYLHTYDGPAIFVESASKLVITIPENTRSVICDSSNYGNYPDVEACIFSNSDITFNGSGSLQVSGYHEDAIRSKDTLKILDLTLTVNSKKDGLRGNDGVIIENADIDLQCEGNGICTKNDKENMGFVSVTGGVMEIISGKYGIRATDNIYIWDCKSNIYGVLGDFYCEGEIYTQEGSLQ